MTIAATAHLLLEWAPKDHEVRLTVVDEHLFVARIDATTGETIVDCRADADDVEYMVVEVPAGIRRGVRGLMNELGLRVGGLDFVVDLTGRWWFLECNPNGQPIARAIAGALGSGS